jgi:tetratricopeptide (TPR) repeat protein
MDGTATRGRRNGLSALTLLTAAALCWGAALSLQAVREARHPLPPVSSDILYFRGGAAVARAALGFDAILADVYWIRAIQHFGGTRRAEGGDKSYSLLYPLLDLTTTLDPHFNIAYRFGSIFLSESYPAGPGRTDQAIALLERGLAADPTRWQYAQDAGFVHYWWRQDYKAAAEWFDRASRIEGAPWWLRSMAATTLAEGGDRQSSRQLWQQLYETTDDKWVKDNAQLKLAQLRALDDIEALALIVRRFTGARGRPPGSWNELIAARWLAGTPLDPSGAPYELRADAPGGVALSRRSPLSPLPPQFAKQSGPTS